MVKHVLCYLLELSLKAFVFVIVTILSTCKVQLPLKEDIRAYFEREVLPFVPDAWIDESKSKVGYEIPFTRYFYQYEAPRPSAEIMAEILELEKGLDKELREVFAP